MNYIIGVIVIVLFLCIPLLAYRKTNFSLKNELKKISKEQNCSITTETIERMYVVGIDEHSNKLFFVRKKNEEIERLCIDVQQIKSYNRVDIKSNSVIEKRSIEIEMKNETQYELVFYDIETDGIMFDAQFQNFENWLAIIEKQIKKK